MVDLKKALRAYTSAELSKGLGISERTARRYRAAGKLPKDRAHDFAEWNAAHKPPTRRDELKLLRMTPQALAIHAGVTVATARDWRKKKRVPQRQRSRLLTDLTGETVDRISKGKTKRFEGKLTTGSYQKANIGAELNNASLAELTRWAGEVGFRKTPGQNVQFVVAIKSDLQIDEQLPGKNYPLILPGDGSPLKRGGKGQQGSHIITTYSHATLGAALKDLHDELSPMMHLDVEMLDVTAIIRDNWKRKPTKRRKGRRS